MLAGSARGLCCLRGSEEAGSAERVFFFLADHHVIVDRDANGFAGGVDLLCHLDVFLARGRIAGGVIVNKDDRPRVQLQCPFHDLARIDRYVVDGACRLLFVGDDGVLAIQKQDAKLFGFTMRHGCAAIVDQIIPGCQDVALQHLGPCHALGKGLGDAQLQVYPVGCALDLEQAMFGCRHHAVQISEGRKQPLGKRLDVDPGNGVEQQQFEDLVFRHRLVPAGKEPGSQPFAVSPVVRPLVAIPVRDHATTRGSLGRQPVIALERPRIGRLRHHPRRRNTGIEIGETAHRALGKPDGPGAILPESGCGFLAGQALPGLFRKLADDPVGHPTAPDRLFGMCVPCRDCDVLPC